MKVTIELKSGPACREPTKASIDKNIMAIERAIAGKPFCSDFVLLTDTLSILHGLRKQLPY